VQMMIDELRWRCYRYR